MNNNKQASFEVMLSIQGMNCAACASRIEKVLKKDDNVEHVSVSYPMRTVWLHTREPISPEPYIMKIKKLGFHAKLMSSIIEDMQHEKRKLGWRLAVSLCLTLPLLLPMLLHFTYFAPIVQTLPVFIFSPLIQLICATLIQLLIAYPFYVNAFYALREKIANMDVLVVLGTTTAYLYSQYELFQHSLLDILQLPLHILEGLYFETTGVVITAVLIGKYIEIKTAIKLQRENQYYLKEDERKVKVIQNKQVVVKDSYEIEKGDYVYLQKGDYAVIDGQIIDGVGHVEESFLTGESGWIEKRKHDYIWAGSNVCEGQFIVKTEQSIYETRLATIKQMIKLGQAQKSKLQTHIDYVIAWFVPFIIALSIVALAFYFIEASSQDRFSAFISVLLVACPCALGLATPISMSIASASFLKQGLIVKDSSAIERLAKVNQFVFDKTGTLTSGELKVNFFHNWKGSRSETIKYMAALEQSLNHPIAEAIKRYAQRENIILPAVQFRQHYVGMGVGGYINKKHIVLGNERLLQHFNIELSFTAKRIADSRFELGETILFLFEEGQLMAIIGLVDKIKEKLKEVISTLNKEGIGTIIATGDHALAAENVAKQLGIKQIYSALLPEQKLDLISQLKKNKVVAMVGDGVNDAPAIASSDVGISLSSGSKEAIEHGHMTLLYGDISAIPKAIKVSRLTLRNIKQNLFFAFSYNIIMLPLALAGYLQPWMAGVAMALSSLMVVTNAFRLHLLLRQTRVLLN